MLQGTHVENVLLGVHAIAISTRDCDLNSALSDIAPKPWLTWKVLKVTVVRRTVLLHFPNAPHVKALDRPCN
jgi:hypothetical protein